MKRIEREKIECCSAKDLKKYSKIINQYFKKKWRFVFFLALASCSVQNEVDKDDFKQIPPNFEAKFYDKLDTIGQYDIRVLTRSFIKEFVDNDKVDYSKPVSIKLKKDIIYLNFTDKSRKEFVLKFQGKCHRKKFVFYTNYETITFPVLFTTKQMTRYTVCFPNENEINFKKFHVGEGMFLLFGASSSYDNIYKFKILKNE